MSLATLPVESPYIRTQAQLLIFQVDNYFSDHTKKLISSWLDSYTRLHTLVTYVHTYSYMYIHCPS